MNIERTQRLKRIHLFEAKKLDAMTIELQKIHGTLQQQHEALDKLEHGFRQTIDDAMQTKASLNQLCQTGCWSKHAQASIDNTKDDIETTVAQRDDLLAQITEQRSIVKGWELLVEKLEAEKSQSVAREAIFTADDNFLRKKNRRAR